MANIITGLIDSNGHISQGKGFEVKADDYGYLIYFYNLRKTPTVIAQPCYTEEAIMCVSLDLDEYSCSVRVQIVDTTGNSRKNPFSFIAVSND